VEKEIVNRVATSKLVTIDLEDFYPPGERVTIDLKDWLFEGLVLREKDFRAEVNDHDWSLYQDKYVAINCSNEAIIPSWAYLLVSISLAPFAKKVVIGSLDLLEAQLYEKIIDSLPLDPYKDRPVIIKGCSEKYIPETAFSSLVSKLLPVARSLMYGEACSSVPLFKKKKSE
jgi:hypothetical protein